MNYSLIKNSFPQFNKERLENTLPVQVLAPSPVAPIETGNYLIPALDTTIHESSVKHVLECIPCRESLLSQLSFSDRNREIADLFPYILIILILILAAKNF